jgi:birA, biotin-[acetyl-CoA-carboxylase] ligase region
MNLSHSAALVPRLEMLEHADSTNDELARRASEHPDDWPDLAVIVTDDQRAGRGRLGRSWIAPPGKTLAISVLVRPVTESGAPLSADGYGWLPLLAGVAMARAVQELGADARVKWPNDVLIDGRKVCGVLSELLPATTSATGSPVGAVLGAGINLTLTEDELPVETATSLRLAGILDPEPDAVLSAYLTELNLLYRGLLAADGDVIAAGTADAVRDSCDSLGRAVRVELPGGGALIGTAVEIDETGRLVVDVNGRRTAVAAGDVTHLRY